jgi:hypothetical protein
MSTANDALKKWRAARANETRALNALKPKHGTQNTSGSHKYTKATKIRYNAQAHADALKTIEKLKKAGILDPEDKMAEEALKEVLITMRGAGNQQTKLAAAKLLLEYTKAKPASKQDVTVRGAEAWLEGLVEDK